MASGCYSLLSLQLPSLGLQPPAPPRRPSLRPCATQPRLLSFFVFSLAILLIRRCLHCTSVGHLPGSLLFFPGFQVPASSPRKGQRASWPSLFRVVVILSLLMTNKIIFGLVSCMEAPRRPQMLRGLNNRLMGHLRLGRARLPLSF